MGDEGGTPVRGAIDASILPAGAIDDLIAVLRARGHRVFGPVVRDGAVDIAEVNGLTDLPVGITDEQEAGRYRLAEAADGNGVVFGFTVGAASFKRLLHPPERRVWHVEETDGAPTVIDDNDGTGDARMAFIGVRACDLAAIGIQDRVLGGEAGYRTRREDAVIVAVECGRAGATCFCASMGTGPEASTGFDIALTEITRETGEHAFLVRTGTTVGAAIVGDLPTKPAEPADMTRAAEAVAAARAGMGRTLDTDGLKEAIAAAAEDPHWQTVADRCLTCANCTMVCPTCYCTGFRDSADLDGSHAERWRHWDSCFSLDFSFAMGGPVRHSSAARYRQWLTHKLSTWVDQFGSFGCVGCGRCITWCPVGIDITAEATALAAPRGD